jgi:hypothetical protein
MTLVQLKQYIAAQLVAPVTLVQKFINCFNAVIDFITQSVNNAIPSWTNILTFQTDATGAGSYCTYPDTDGALRFWKTKVDDNIGNVPPTNPLIIEDDFWIEVSPSSGSARKEWAPGFFGVGLITVYYDLNGDGTDPADYILTDPARPFHSTDFVAELGAGKWRRFNDSGVLRIIGFHDAGPGAFPANSKQGYMYKIGPAPAGAGEIMGVALEPGAKLTKWSNSAVDDWTTWDVTY